MKKIKRFIAIIPARGGSKGLPGKNTKFLGEKPLIAWTILAAKLSPLIDKVIVSTDCIEIARIAIEYGAEVPFVRPADLAGDESTTADVIEHAIKSLSLKFESVVVLQPTSPFRTSCHIDEAVSLYEKKNSDSLVSVTVASKSPFWTYWLGDELKIQPILDLTVSSSRRQDVRKAYSLNGAIYIVRCSKFQEERKFIYEDTISYIMDKQSSVDIDDIIDFKFAETILGI